MSDTGCCCGWKPDDDLNSRESINAILEHIDEHEAQGDKVRILPPGVEA